MLNGAKAETNAITAYEELESRGALERAGEKQKALKAILDPRATVNVLSRHLTEDERAQTIMIEVILPC